MRGSVALSSGRRWECDMCLRCAYRFSSQTSNPKQKLKLSTYLVTAVDGERSAVLILPVSEGVRDARRGQPAERSGASPSRSWVPMRSPSDGLPGGDHSHLHDISASGRKGCLPRADHDGGDAGGLIGAVRHRDGGHRARDHMPQVRWPRRRTRRQRHGEADLAVAPAVDAEGGRAPWCPPACALVDEGYVAAALGGPEADPVQANQLAG